MAVIPQNAIVTIDIEKAPSHQDFVLLVKNIIKFVIVQKSQIPPSQNYDSLKMIKEAKNSQIVVPKDFSNAEDKLNLRKRRKNARIKERNHIKIASYIENMESLFDAVNSGLEIAKNHEKLYIFLGGTIASSRAGICIKIPRLENNPKESIASVKLQSKVLSGLLSHGATGFFAKRVPITNLHICLSTNQELASTRVYSQLGCRRTRLLTIEFQVSTSQNSSLSEVNENVEEMINNFSSIMTPMEGQKSVKRRKPVRRLTFSTPIHKGETSPFLNRQRLISGDSGNVSGIQSFNSFIEDSYLCLAGSDPQFELKTYRLGFPVKGLKLIRVFS